MNKDSQHIKVPVADVSLDKLAAHKLYQCIAKAFVEGILPTEQDRLGQEVYYVVDDCYLEVRIKVKVNDENWAEVPLCRIPPDLWKSKVSC